MPYVIGMALDNRYPLYKNPFTKPPAILYNNPTTPPFETKTMQTRGRPMLYGPGFKFGQLTIVERKANKATVVCSCGNALQLTIPALLAGKQDCGCVALKSQVEKYNEYNKPGNMLYHIWLHMISRCHDQNHPSFKDYGARGITVCSDWHDFEKFKSDMGLRPGPDYTVDRIDPNGNYEPSNCQWATAFEQAKNKRARLSQTKEEFS